jgi:hypothetical protein
LRCWPPHHILFEVLATTAGGQFDAKATAAGSDFVLIPHF